jgi:uncharacterized protein
MDLPAASNRPTSPSMLTARQIAAVAEALAPHDCAAIYLFGSRATGQARPASDIDLACLPRQPIDPLECFRLAGVLGGQLAAPVDLVDLRRASTVMAKEVLRTGILLQERDSPRRRQFEMLALSAYARLNEERHECLSTR